MKRHPEGTRLKKVIIGLIVILVLCLLVPISLAKSAPAPAPVPHLLVPVFQASSATEPVTIDTTEVSNVTQFNNQRKLVCLSDGTLYAVYEKQLQVLVDSGTTTGGSNTTLQDTTKSWPAEEFAHDLVEFTIDTTPYHRMVTSNTATELTFAVQPPEVTVVDLALNIDDTPITLAYGDTAADIATKIADAVTASGATTTAVADGAAVTFTARVAGADGDGPVDMTDNTYSGGTVPAITLAGGTDDPPVAATATITIPAGVLEGITYKIWRSKTQVYVKKSPNDGQTLPDEPISTYSGMENYNQRYPSIAVDSSGYLHVVWSGKATGYTTFDQLWYAKYTDSSWTEPVRISTYPGMETWSAQSGASIAVDSSDYLHVVWYGCATGYTPHQQIWYAKCTTTFWTEPVRISTDPGMENYLQAFPSIAIDSKDYLHVVWYGEATGYRIYKQIWYAKYTEDTEHTGSWAWSTPVRISTCSGMQNTHQRAPSIAVDSAVDSKDCLHVVWFGYVGDYAQIWYAKCTTSWATPVKISTSPGMENYSQFDPSIAVDRENNLHVVWDGCATAGYYKVWYAKYPDSKSSWETPKCLQLTGQNKAPNARWSRYPSSNIPDAGVDYVFTEGELIPVNICLGQEG